MEKRISLECGNLEKSEVTDLNLDHCKSSSLSGLTKEFVSLESLSLINNRLSSLEGFPSLLKLRKLELADNFLSGGFEALQGCENLQKINLSGNKISDVECLRPLSKLPKLVSLDLFSNEITSSESFPENVKEILPNVQSFCEDELDGISSGEEEDDDEKDRDDEYEDEENSDENQIEPLGIDSALVSSSGGKVGVHPSNGAAGTSQDSDDEDDDDFDEDQASDDEDDDDVSDFEESGVKQTGGKVGAGSDIEENEESGDEDDEDEEEGEDGPGLAYLYGNDIDNENEDDDEEFKATSGEMSNSAKTSREDQLESLQASRELDKEDEDSSGPSDAKIAKLTTRQGKETEFGNG